MHILVNCIISCVVFIWWLICVSPDIQEGPHSDRYLPGLKMTSASICLVCRINAECRLHDDEKYRMIVITISRTLLYYTRTLHFWSPVNHGDIRIKLARLTLLRHCTNYVKKYIGVASVLFVEHPVNHSVCDCMSDMSRGARHIRLWT